VDRDEDKKVFPHFDQTRYIAFGNELLFIKSKAQAKGWLKLQPPQMFGPPERCYGINESDLPGFTTYAYGKGQGVYFPCKPGTFFYREGYSNTLWFMQDVLEHICKVSGIAPGLTPMVETTLASRPGRAVVQLVNLTGHFGNSYYEPIPVEGVALHVPVSAAVKGARTLRGGEKLPFKQAGGYADISLPCLREYEALVLELE
jgi:hypothetical protein